MAREYKQGGCQVCSYTTYNIAGRVMLQGSNEPGVPMNAINANSHASSIFNTTASGLLIGEISDPNAFITSSQVMYTDVSNSMPGYYYYASNYGDNPSYAVDSTGRFSFSLVPEVHT